MFKNKRDQFLLEDGIVYLDGNSLGPLSLAARQALTNVIENDWQKGLVSSWSDAGWIELSERVGNKIAPLIGAEADTVVVADSVSVNIFKLAAAALALLPERSEILTEEGSFPTDAYILDGLARLSGKSVRRVKRADLKEAITKETAFVLATHVHYVTADLINLKELTKAAHEKGSLTLIDLSHTVGALPVDLSAAGIDFAVGCGYKYLNGGPGSPAFAYVAPRHLEALDQPLQGWMGHHAPFKFEEFYKAAPGVSSLKCGTPPIISMTALDAAINLFKDVDMTALWQRSKELSALFVEKISIANLKGLTLASPSNPDDRGSHVSFAHEEGYALVQALIEKGITGDFRQPNIARFGFAPLYLDEQDILHAAEALIEVLTSESYQHPCYKKIKSVT